MPGRLSISVRKPLGVIAGIAPFNSPFLLSMKKIVYRDRDRQHIHPQAIGGNADIRGTDRRPFRRGRTAARSAQRGAGRACRGRRSADRRP
jgi:hypothetical protein